jgi:hypothetical protein
MAFADARSIGISLPAVTADSPQKGQCMKPSTWAILLSSIVAQSGCSMCQSPYDYTGPVANSPAAYGQRQNSAFANGSMAPQAMGMAAAPANQPVVENGTETTPVASSQSPPAQRY